VAIEAMTAHSARDCTVLYESLYGRSLRYRALAAHSPARPGYVARQGTVITGFVTGVEWAPDVVEIDNLLVDPQWQRRGWGSALLRTLVEGCLGRYRALVSTNSDLHDPGRSGKRDATSFYRRHGFDVVATTPQTRVLWRSL
jgi:ribosomal protein S18 acetylase RimI-like enzyme